MCHAGATLLLLIAWHPSGVAGATAWRTVAGTGKSGFGGATYRSKVHDFAVETRLNSPWGLALDAAFDRLYVSDTVNGVVRSVDLQTGLMEVIAGTDVLGNAGDGGSAVEAQLTMPTGLALDGPGRVLYVSDSLSHVVRAVALDPGRVYQAEVNVSLPSRDGGVVATTAVSGAYVSDGCPDATNPSNPYNVSPLFMGSRFCQGSTGKGYVQFVDLIVEYLEFQVLATSGPGTYELRFRYADRYDRVHAAGERRLRVTVNGVTVTPALLFRPTGNVQAGLRDKYEWAVCEAQLSLLPPRRNVVRLELAGYGGPRVDLLYVVPPQPVIWTVAGTGAPGPPGCRHGCEFNTTRDALASPLHTPMGLAIDDVDKILYIADSDNGRVLRLDTRLGKVSTIAGGAGRDSTRDGEWGGALAGKLFRPLALALDGARRWLYISDADDHKVKRMDLWIDKDLRPILTVAGFGRQQAPFEHLLRQPHGLAIDEATGTLYVADSEHSRVRMVPLSNGTCPMELISRLRCGHEGMGETECWSLGCCWDPTCLDGFNPDGRFRGPNATPSDVLTRVDQKLSVPPVAYIRRGSGFCCYPNLREMRVLDALDAPAGLAWDARDGSIFAASMRSHKLVKLVARESECAADAGRC